MVIAVCLLIMFMSSLAACELFGLTTVWADFEKDDIPYVEKLVLHGFVNNIIACSTLTVINLFLVYKLLGFAGLTLEFVESWALPAFFWMAVVHVLLSVANIRFLRRMSNLKHFLLGMVSRYLRLSGLNFLLKMYRRTLAARKLLWLDKVSHDKVEKLLIPEILRRKRVYTFVVFALHFLGVGAYYWPEVIGRMHVAENTFVFTEMRKDATASTKL